MFETEISRNGNIISGPLRAPKQMLEHQNVSEGKSIHDDDMAEKLGFRAGPIEGPTHFSQFEDIVGK